jgi:hypothetical protein
MTLADLGGRLARESDGPTWWKLVWEFLEEYRWEPADAQPALLTGEPAATGDERWDVLLAALAEYLAAQLRRHGPCRYALTSTRTNRSTQDRRGPPRALQLTAVPAGQ